MTTTNIEKIEIEAKQWLLIINSGDASDSDFINFNKWLAAQPEHKDEYQRLESIWLEFDDIRDAVLNKYGQEANEQSKERSILQSFLNAVSFPRFSLTNVTMAGLATAAVAIVIYLPSKTIDIEDEFSSSSIMLASDLYSTGTGEIIPIALPDGSMIELGPQSRLEVDFSTSSRNIRLLWGEAYFKVAKDSNRPFIVVSGNGTIKAIGTEFEIRKGVRETSVTVHEGEVQVSTMSGKTRQAVASKSLTAAEQVSYAISGPMSAIRNIDLSMESGWRNGRMIFNNQPLLEVVADLNRYGTTHISIADERLFDIEVNGVFKMGESEAVLKAIERTLPARAVRNKSNKITLLYSESH